MKKLLYLSLILFVTAASLPSCNKKLKKELEDLDNSVNDLKAKNAELEEQLATTNSTLNNINEAFEADKPVNWTITGTDNNYSPGVVVTKSFAARYQLGPKDNYQYIWNVSGNIWEIYVEKYSDFEWTYYAGFDIHVDATSNTLSPAYDHSMSAQQYSDYDSGTMFIASANTINVGETISIITMDLDTDTGEVNVKLEWANMAGATFGGAEDGTIEFKGTCFNYQ